MAAPSTTTPSLEGRLAALETAIQTVVGKLQAFELEIRTKSDEVAAKLIAAESAYGSLAEQKRVHEDITAETIKSVEVMKEEMRRMMDRTKKHEETTSSMIEPFKNLTEEMKRISAENQEIAGVLKAKPEGKMEEMHNELKKMELRIAEFKETTQKDARNTAQRPYGGNHKSILESKVVLSLKNLDSDKTSYKVWKDKFDNAIESARPGYKAVIKMLGDKAISVGIPVEDGEFNTDKWESWFDEVKNDNDDLQSNGATAERFKKRTCSRS